jgi:hypothetical protein
LPFVNACLGALYHRYIVRTTDDGITGFDDITPDRNRQAVLAQTALLKAVGVQSFCEEGYIKRL